MTDATAYAEAEFADMWFAAAAPDGAVANADLAVALWTVAPANAPDGTNEVAGDSYSRISGVTWNNSNASAPREYTNGDVIDYGVLDTATQTSVEGVVLVRTDTANTASGTEEFIYANGDVSEVVDAGNEFKINAGDANFSID